MSSREMKLGSMVMILRPGFRVLNGNHPVLLVQKKARQSRSNIKVVMIVFFDLDGIVRAEFAPRNITGNSEYYKGLLESLRNNVRRKRPEKWANGFILHHDNAPCHTSLLVWQFLSNKLLRCTLIHLIHWIWHRDFWLFPKVKMTIKGTRFESIQDIEAAMTVQLKTLTKEDFQNCFRKWREQWNKCV